MTEETTVASSDANSIAHLAGIATTTEAGVIPGTAPQEMETMEVEKEPTFESQDGKDVKAGAEGKDAAEADDPKDADDPSEKDIKDEAPRKAKEPQSRVRWTDDGGFEVTRGDEKLVLSEEEVSRIARKRIGRAHEQAREAKTELAQEREARLKAERDLAQAKLAQEQAAEKQPTSPDKPWTAQGADKPAMEDFDSVDEWADARDEWKAAQAETKQLEKEQPADGLTDEQREAQTQWFAKAKEFSQEALKVYGDEYQTHVIDNDEAPFSPIFVDVVREVADDPAALLIGLGKDVDTAHQIAGMIIEGQGAKAIKTLARFEAALGKTIAADTDGDTPAAVPTRPTMKPPKPAGTPRRSPADLAEQSTDDYFAWRKSQNW